MSFEAMLGRSFSKHERKRIERGALMCCFFMAFTLCIVFKPYITPSPIIVDLKGSMASRLKMLKSTQETIEPPQLYTYLEKSVTPIIHNLSNSRSQIYEMNGDIRIHGNSSTIFIATTQQLNTTSWTVKPYARYIDRYVMGKVRSLKIITQNPNTAPPCSRSFDVPALVFSAGGYTGNLFHDFSDVLTPLYLTSRRFDKEVIFLVASKHSWWTDKYKLILNNLSRYDVVDIDNSSEVLCFPRMIVGLESYKEFGIDQSILISPNHPLKLTSFTKFLRDTYMLNRGHINGCDHRPRLLVISRKKTRHLRNERDVVALARSVGFDVTIRETGWQVSTVSKFVNSFDVMVAVHGAGITNMVYLPEKAIVVEIVPLGLDFVSRQYFEIPSKDMNLRYLRYKVSVNESSLIEKFGVENEVFRNPSGVRNKGWDEFRSLYLNSQDVRVDLVRFRKTLLEAMELVCS